MRRLSDAVEGRRWAGLAPGNVGRVHEGASQEERVFRSTGRAGDLDRTERIAAPSGPRSGADLSERAKDSDVQVLERPGTLLRAVEGGGGEKGAAGGEEASIEVARAVLEAADFLERERLLQRVADREAAAQKLLVAAGLDILGGSGTGLESCSKTREGTASGRQSGQTKAVCNRDATTGADSPTIPPSFPHLANRNPTLGTGFSNPPPKKAYPPMQTVSNRLRFVSLAGQHSSPMASSVQPLVSPLPPPTPSYPLPPSSIKTWVAKTSKPGPREESVALRETGPEGAATQSERPASSGAPAGAPQKRPGSPQGEAPGGARAGTDAPAVSPLESAPGVVLHERFERAPSGALSEPVETAQEDAPAGRCQEAILGGSKEAPHGMSGGGATEKAGERWEVAKDGGAEVRGSVLTRLSAFD